MLDVEKAEEEHPMAKPKHRTLALSPEWLDRVEAEIGWLWAQQERATREAAMQQIAAFLAKHEGLLELLNEGIQHLRQAFPENRSFMVTLEADREAPNWAYLVVSIKTSLPVEEADSHLDAFADAWLLDHVAQIGDKLLFDLEYL